MWLLSSIEAAFLQKLSLRMVVERATCSKQLCCHGSSAVCHRVTGSSCVFSPACNNNENFSAYRLLHACQDMLYFVDGRCMQSALACMMSDGEAQHCVLSPFAAERYWIAR